MSDLDTVAKATRSETGKAAEAARPIADFLRKASFETTRLAAADLAALQDIRADTAVYVSAVLNRPSARAGRGRRRLAGARRRAHPARRGAQFCRRGNARNVLARMADRAGVRRALIIGGDRAEPAGPFHAAIDLIESGLLQDHGIEEIGIAGYPDGHPRIAPLDLDRVLAAKIEAADQTGLRVYIATQFAFAADSILRWLACLRDLGIDHPVRVGFAGPTTLPDLLRFARICGVKTSALALVRNAGLARNMFALTTPDRLVRPLAEACADGRYGDVAPHLYSFGGLAATVRWAAAATAERIELDHASGFSIAPP